MLFNRSLRLGERQIYCYNLNYNDLLCYSSYDTLMIMDRNVERAYKNKSDDIMTFKNLHRKKKERKEEETSAILRDTLFIFFFFMFYELHKSNCININGLNRTAFLFFSSLVLYACMWVS